MPKKLFDPFTFAYKRTYNPKTKQYSWVRLVSPQIPDEILTTGNAEILRAFYEAHKDTLTPADLKYMHVRMLTAFKLDQLERKAKEQLGRGEAPPRPEVTREKGYIGLGSIKLSERQTSNNGCCSCGLHLLLKSRGIDLTQEEIRAYRPDFKPGEEQKMSAQRRMIMDSDSTNYVFDQADLIQKVLPNTCMTNVTINPMTEFYKVEGGAVKPPSPLDDPGYYTMTPKEQQTRLAEWQKEDNRFRAQVRKAYSEQVRQQLGDIVRKALTEDRSPIVLNTGGNHFITITGIREDGKKLRVEDSIGSKEGATNYLLVDDLIKLNLGMNGKGMTLTWLKDLPTPEYVPESPDKAQGEKDQAREEKMTENLAAAEQASGKALFENSKECIKVTGDGSLTVKDVPGTNITTSDKPKPGLGMLKGLSVNDSLKLDQTLIQQTLGGGTLKGDVENPNSPEAEIYLGSQEFYYPKKLCCKGDPALDPAALKTQSLEQQKKTAQELTERLRRQPLKAPAPEEGTFAAQLRDQKQQLYLQSTDTALYLAKIYALNKVLQDRPADPGQDKTLLKITEEEATRIENLTCKVIPAMETLLDRDWGKVQLPMMACEDGPESYLRIIDGFGQDRLRGTNANREECRSALTEAFDTMTATGTGRNFFGVKRDSNSPEYDAMMAELRAYKEKLDAGQTPDGFDNHNLTQKCLGYLDGKLKVRSTTTGVVRFDNTMKVLKQIMPEKEFTAICNRINQVRGLTGMDFDKNYVSPQRYAPKAAKSPAVTTQNQPQNPSTGATEPAPPIPGSINSV